MSTATMSPKPNWKMHPTTAAGLVAAVFVAIATCCEARKAHAESGSGRGASRMNSDIPTPEEALATIDGPVTTSSGLKYRDLRMGTGATAKKGDKLVVHYTGWLTSGKKFDSSVDRKEPFEFRVGAGMVIKGWDEGVAGMRIGGKRKLIIPSKLGYGAMGVGDIIPADATLIFDVELLKAK